MAKSSWDNVNQNINENNNINILISVDNRISTYSAPRIIKAIEYVTQDGRINADNIIIDYIFNGLKDEKGHPYSNEEEENKVKELVKNCLHHFNGLVIPGNSDDINPAFYSGDEKIYATIDLSQPSNRRNLIEILLVKEAIQSGKPILGICGGNQIINVALGGKVDDVINEQNKVDYQDEKGIEEEEIDYLGNTHLYTIIKSAAKNSINENSDIENTSELSQGDYESLNESLDSISTDQESDRENNSEPNSEDYQESDSENESDTDFSITNPSSGIIHTEKSLHHQIIVKEFLPKELQISAEDNRYLIKAIEIKGHHPFLIGTQFHPEHKFDPNKNAVGDSQNIALFKEFTAACYAVEKTKKHKEKVLGELELNTNLSKKGIKIQDLLKRDHLDEETFNQLSNAITSVNSLQFFIELIYPQNNNKHVKSLPVTIEQIINISKNNNIIKNDSDLIKILQCLPEEQRYNFAKIFQNKIESDKNITAILELLPVKHRLNFVISQIEKIQTTAFLEHISIDLDLLLEKNITPNLKNRIGNTLLHQAVLNNDADLIHTLFLKNADINMTNIKGHSPLHLAILNQDKEIIKLLLETNKIDFNKKDSNGDTILHFAVNNGNKDIFSLILNATNLNLLNTVNNDGNTPFHLAAENGSHEIMNFLLQQNYINSIDSITQPKHQTALHLAAKNGHANVVELLLKSGSKIDSKDRDGNTALHLATENNRLPVIECLLNAGINSSIENNNHKKAIDLSNDDQIQQKLYKSLLHYAVLNNKNEMLGSELKRATKMTLKVCLESKFDNGNTLLHIAAEKGFDDIVKTLLSARVRTDTKNTNNKTAFDLANDKIKSIIQPNRATKPYSPTLFQPPSKQPATPHYNPNPTNRAPLSRAPTSRPTTTASRPYSATAYSPTSYQPPTASSRANTNLTNQNTPANTATNTATNPSHKGRIK